MRVLGVDPGSVKTGFGVVDYDGGRLTLVEQGAINTSRGAELCDRLETIYRVLGEVIARTNPAVLAVETPFAGINPRSLIQLAQARGVILLAARTAGLRIFEYSPRSIKSAVVGYGAAEKAQVSKMVQLLIVEARTLTLSPDAADALAVAICHAHSAGSQQRLRMAR
ncbi:MAG: crossover junction endodeoxyribonuclease RuvC [Acidobacteriota bacterium]